VRGRAVRPKPHKLAVFHPSQTSVNILSISRKLIAVSNAQMVICVPSFALHIRGEALQDRGELEDPLSSEMRNNCDGLFWRIGDFSSQNKGPESERAVLKQRASRVMDG
jgi:hypothetical protein